MEFEKWWLEHAAMPVPSSKSMAKEICQVQQLLAEVKPLVEAAWNAGRQAQRELDADWLQAYGFVDIDAAIRRGAPTPENVKAMKQDRINKLQCEIAAIRRGGV